MHNMFSLSEFKGDISAWKPYEVELRSNTLEKSKCLTPYWANYESAEERKIAIDTYHLTKELSQELNENRGQPKKIKI